MSAGIVGASRAFHLTQLDAEVYLIDSNAPGRATFAGAGMVSSAFPRSGPTPDQQPLNKRMTTLPNATRNEIGLQIYHSTAVAAGGCRPAPVRRLAPNAQQNLPVLYYSDSGA